MSTAAKQNWLWDFPHLIRKQTCVRAENRLGEVSIKECSHKKLATLKQNIIVNHDTGLQWCHYVEQWELWQISFLLNIKPTAGSSHGDMLQGLWLVKWEYLQQVNKWKVVSNYDFVMAPKLFNYLNFCSRFHRAAQQAGWSFPQIWNWWGTILQGVNEMFQQITSFLSRLKAAKCMLPVNQAMFLSTTRMDLLPRLSTTSWSKYSIVPFLLQSIKMKTRNYLSARKMFLHFLKETYDPKQT